MLRDLGGLIRTAGDLAIERGNALTLSQDVLDAKKMATTLENQISIQYLDLKKKYNLIKTTEKIIGRVNGLAVMGSSAGIVTPIEAAITPAQSTGSGKILATGQLRVIARESVQNISALIKNYLGTDISNHDIHILCLSFE